MISSLKFLFVFFISLAMIYVSSSYSSTKHHSKKQRLRWETNNPAKGKFRNRGKSARNDKCSMHLTFSAEVIESHSRRMNILKFWKEDNLLRISTQGWGDEGNMVMFLQNLKLSNNKAPVKIYIEDVFTEKEFSSWYLSAGAYIENFNNKNFARIIKLVTELSIDEVDSTFLLKYFKEAQVRLKSGYLNEQELLLITNSLRQSWSEIMPKDFLLDLLNAISRDDIIHNFYPEQHFQILDIVSNFADKIPYVYVKKLISVIVKNDSYSLDGELSIGRSVFLTAVSKWGPYVSEKVVTNWMKVSVLGTFGTFNVNKLSLLMSAFVRMNIVPAKAWLKELFSSLMIDKGAKIKQLSIKQAVSFIQAFEFFKIKAPENISKQIKERVLVLLDEHSLIYKEDAEYCYSLPFLFMRSDYEFALKIYSKYIDKGVIKIDSDDLGTISKGQRYLFVQYSNFVKRQSSQADAEKLKQQEQGKKMRLKGERLLRSRNKQDQRRGKALKRKGKKLEEEGKLLQEENKLLQIISTDLQSILEGQDVSLRDVSRFQQTVFTFLRDRLPSDIVMIGEEFIPEIAGHVDIFLPQSKIVIQVDGWHHFLRNIDTGTINEMHGLHDYQEEILKAAGYEVFRVPYFGWESSAEYKNNVVREVLSFVEKQNNIK